MLAEVPKVIALAVSGGLEVPVREVALQDVEGAWSSSDRLVVVM